MKCIRLLYDANWYFTYFIIWIIYFFFMYIAIIQSYTKINKQKLITPNTHKIIINQGKYSEKIRFSMEASCLYVKTLSIWWNSSIDLIYRLVINSTFLRNALKLFIIRFKQQHKHTRVLNIGKSAKNSIYLVSRR